MHRLWNYSLTDLAPMMDHSVLWGLSVVPLEDIMAILFPQYLLYLYSSIYTDNTYTKTLTLTYLLYLYSSIYTDNTYTKTLHLVRPLEAAAYLWHLLSNQ